MKSRLQNLAVIGALGAIISLPLSAQETPIPRTFDSSGAPASGPAATDAVSAATTAPGSPNAPDSFLGFESKEAFHRFAGWGSGSVLLAAGIVGAVHAYDMMSAAHAYRDAQGIDRYDTGLCTAEIEAVYNTPTEQALRWTHVGLLGAGETLYLANAITGSGFMQSLPPGWSRARIHRYAFFTHAGLMAAEGVMGYFTSEAMERGDHATFRVLLTAHAGVGIAIPVVILAAGALMDPNVNPFADIGQPQG